VTPFRTPFDLEKFFKFKYATFATEVTLGKSTASVISHFIRYKHKNNLAPLVENRLSRAMSLSVLGYAWDRHSHRSRVIDTLCPRSIAAPIFLITHESYFTTRPLTLGTIGDDGL
jgi:hypothetical protein